MKYGMWGLIGSTCLTGLLWLCSGCAEQSTDVDRGSQVSGYVEPENESQYTREQREAIRPSVPRIYW